MTTVNANMIAAKDDLLELILKLGSSKTPEQTEQWLALNLGTDLFGAWVTYDEDEIVGLIVAEVTPDNSVYIAMDWVKNGLSNEELLLEAEEWAKELGLNRMIKYTNKSPATYIKKYGWSVWQTVLVKEL
jgi:hypothetical protein